MSRNCRLHALRAVLATLALSLAPACGAQTGEAARLQSSPAPAPETRPEPGPEPGPKPDVAPAPADFVGKDIFVIGDSITTGFGALGAGPDCAATEDTHAPDASYAALLAGQLQGRLTVDAVSGRGLVYNSGGAAGQTVKAALVDGGALRSGAYARLKPALVMIHIGTNDFFQNDPGVAFEDTYLALLEEIAAAYPDAQVLGLLGPMLHGGDADRAAAAINRAIDRANLSTGRAVRFLQLTYADDPATAFGCQWHPGTATHALMAKTIEDFLSQERTP